MRVPKHLNSALLKANFDNKMREAFALEAILEEKTFEISNESCYVKANGLPTILELEFKQDCSASQVLKAINETLHQAHIARDAMAKDLIRR
jgi:hypothetical protein